MVSFFTKACAKIRSIFICGDNSHCCDKTENINKNINKNININLYCNSCSKLINDEIKYEKTLHTKHVSIKEINWNANQKNS